MKKFLFTSAILGVTALCFTGCTSSSDNGNKPVLNTNTNTAVMNSNMNTTTMNANMSSNMNSSMNSNMSANSNKTVSSSDKEFINKAAQGGLAEVQMGGLAVQKAQNEEVKTFGQKMVTDHSKANSELKTIAAQKGVEVTVGLNSEQTEEMSKLSKLSGAAFDKEYVRIMVADHEKDVAEFQKQAAIGTDQDTKEFAQDTLPTLKMHLDMIKTISGKIK